MRFKSFANGQSIRLFEIGNSIHWNAGGGLTSAPTTDVEIAGFMKAFPAAAAS